MTVLRQLLHLETDLQTTDQIDQLVPNSVKVGEWPSGDYPMDQRVDATTTGHKHDRLARHEVLTRLVKIFLPWRLKTDPDIAADLPEKIEQDQEP